jgi:ribonuclease P protein component
MLKKVNRLAKDKDIKTAFARGRSFFNPFFNIKFLPGQEGKRFTVVVSTKVYKKAVSRNRLKRLLREHLRKNLAGFKNGSYIIVAKPKVSGLAETEALKNFLEARSKLK